MLITRNLISSFAHYKQHAPASNINVALDSFGTREMDFSCN